MRSPFFSTGQTRASLKGEGNTPVCRDSLMSIVREGARWARLNFRIDGEHEIKRRRFAPASCSSHSFNFASYLNCYGSYFQCNFLKNGWLKTFGIFL